jgi:hypothetical protein
MVAAKATLWMHLSGFWVIKALKAFEAGKWRM